MITAIELPMDFHPGFIKEYKVDHDTIAVGLQYRGPLPTVDVRMNMEVTYYIVIFAEIRKTGKIEWDSRNGPLTYEQMAQALAILWDPEKKTLSISS